MNSRPAPVASRFWGSTLVLVLAVVLTGCPRHGNEKRDDAARAMLAELTAVPFEGHVSGFPWKPWREQPVPRPWLQRWARVQGAVDSPADVAGLRGAALADLLAGRWTDARARLLEGCRRFPLEAALWNDLSVAHLAFARYEPDAAARHAVRALDAALHARRLSGMAGEPARNVVVALERLGLQHEAGEIRQDTSEGALTAPSPAALPREESGDMQSIRERLERDLLPAWARDLGRDATSDATPPRPVADAATALARHGDAFYEHVVTHAMRTAGARRRMLACGFDRYARGVQLYEQSQREASLSELLAAQRCLMAAGSPLELRARTQVGILRYQFRDLRTARQMLHSVSAEAGRHGYRSVRALADWPLGIVAMQSGRTEVALAAYARSEQAFERVAEFENVGALASVSADALRRLGEQNDGWRHLGRALASVSRMHTVRRRYTVYYNASLFAEDDGLQDAARWFQDVALRTADQRNVANTRIEALARRASLRAMDDTAGAWQDLRLAEELLNTVSSDSARDYVRHTILESRARLIATQEPEAALALLGAARQFFERVETSEAPRLMLEEGRVLRRLGRVDEADRRFLRASRVVAERWSGLTRDDYRVAYGEEMWPIFAERISLAGDRDVDGSLPFEVAEEARGLALGSTPARLKEIERSMPSGATLLVYAALPDRLLRWTVERGGTRLRVTPMSYGQLEAQVRGFVAAIDSGLQEDQVARQGVELSQLLLDPAHWSESSQPLVVVPDGALGLLPFAALPVPAKVPGAAHDYLLSRRPVLTTPMASLAFSGHRARSAPRKPLLVGVARSSDPSLPVLVHARQEVTAVAGLYTGPTLMVDAEATASAVLQRLPAHDALHFAGHAIANDRNPWRSRLLMGARAAPDHELTVEHLTRARVGHLALVVLSACGTAAGPVRRTQGAISVIRPFVVAGVPTVVGTLWDVDDDHARDMLVAFHRGLVRGLPGPEAMRQAQLQRIREGSTRYPMREWAAFLVAGRWSASTD